MNQDALLQDIKLRLRMEHGSRLRGIVLYGSEARGEASPDSDIDLLVLLDGMHEYGRDLRRNVDARYPLSLEVGRRISAKPVDSRDYDEVDCPLYRRARQEGVPA